MTDNAIPASNAGRSRVSRRDAFHDVAKSVYYAIFGIIAFLVMIPIAALVYGSFRTSAPGIAGEWTLQNYAGLLSAGVLASIWTTLWIALLSSVLCLIIGIAIAFVVHRTDFKYATVTTALIALSFYFPSFILAMAWIIVGSPGGVINAALGAMLGASSPRIDIYSVWGIVFVMVLHQVPFVYLTMRGPIISMDGAYEEAARVCGAKSQSMLFRVTLPLLGYSILSSFILTFVLMLEQFAIPAMIGIPGQVTVLATQLYLLVRFPPVDYGLAAAIGLTLSAATALAVWAQRRVTRAARLTTITGKAGRAIPLRLGRWKWAAYALCFGYIFLALLMPMVILIYTSLLKWMTANPFEASYTLRNYFYIWESAATARSFWNTFIVSGVGAAVGVMLGLLASYFTLRLKPNGYRALDFTTILPFGVPGIVMGLGLLWAYAYLPLPLYGTLTVIILAFVTRFLPYATETIGGQLVQIDKSLEEAAWLAGASRLATLRRVLLPLVWPSVQGAYFLLFMAFFREVSSAILLYTGSTQVISISIWAHFEQANWGLASALSVVATLIIFVAMSLLMWLTPSARRH